MGAPTFLDSLDSREIEFPNRPQKLAEIECSLEHRLALRSWEAQFTASSNNLARKFSSRNFSTFQLYQTLALFFFFQGLILIVVTQASNVKCQNSWLIFTLSAMVSMATFSACIQKLREIAEGKMLYLEEKDLCTALFRSIEDLKQMGTDFNLTAGQPQPHFQQIYTDRDHSGICSWICGFCKTWIWSYAGAVCYLLLAFSGVTLTAVRVIVCDPQRNI